MVHGLNRGLLELGFELFEALFQGFDSFDIAGDFAEVDLLSVVVGEGHDGATGVLAGLGDGLAHAATGGDHDAIGDF